MFDIANVDDPGARERDHASNPQAIVHNAHVKGSELYLANYTEGIRALDLTDPAHPAEFGCADSYPGPSGGYAGVWERLPVLPSGTVIASDMQTGLYVYRPVRNYGLVRVKVNGSGALASGQACGANGSCCCAPATCTCPNHVAHVRRRRERRERLRRR
mgnify:CR=1 FL=1